MVQQGDVERRHAVEEGRLHAANRRDEVVQVARVRHERERAAADEPVPLHADVGVDMKQRQRHEQDIVGALHDRGVPGLTLHAGHHVGAVGAEHAFWRAGGAAAHQQHRRIGRGHRRRRRTMPAVHEQQMGEIVIARFQHDAIAVLLLAEQREQHAQQRRKMLLDVGRDHALQPGARLHVLHAPVIASERDDGLDAVLADGAFELVFGVDRIERREDRAELPRAELRDEELRAVRQQQADAIAAPDAQRRERRGAGVAQARQLAVRHPRALEEQHRCAGPGAGGVREVVHQRAIGIGRQRGGNVRIVVGEPGRGRGHAREIVALP